MLRNTIALLLPLPLALLSSCGGSSGGPGSLVAPSGKPPIVVSTNSADAPDYLCDGVDDEVEINLALQNADTSTTAARSVLLKAGTYHVTKSVIVTSNLTLRGAGPTTVIQLQDNAPSMVATAGIVRLKNDTRRGLDKRVHDVTLEDFVVDGNRAHQTVAVDEKKYGFYCEGDFIVFRRLVARNCAGYGFDPHSAQDTVPSLHVTIEDCESFGNATDGFTLDQVQSSTFTRNYTHDNDRHGINLTSTTAGVTLSNCRSLRNGATGLVAQNGTRDVVVQACELANNAFEGIYLRDADGCSLLGNTLNENLRSGITLRLSDHTTVSDNHFRMSDPGPGARAVVLVDSAAVNIVRSNTLVSATAHAGVLEAGTSDYNIVRDNVIDVGSQPIILIGPHSSQAGNVLL